MWVHANATEIRQSNIIDERANTEVCGFVTGLIDQIDTTNLFAQYDDAFNEFMDSLQNGTGCNIDLIQTFTNFGQMLIGYTCYPIKALDHFSGSLYGYGISQEEWDINNGEKLLVWWNGTLLMQDVDYKLTRGGYTDPLWHIIPFDKDKYVGGSLVLQSWYHPDNVPKDPFEDDNDNNNNKKGAAAISGSAETDVSGKKTQTVADSGESTATGKINTISGKSEKVGD